MFFHAKYFIIIEFEIANLRMSSTISLQGEILSDDVFISAAERFGKLAHKETVTAEHPVPYLKSRLDLQIKIKRGWQ